MATLVSLLDMIKRYFLGRQTNNRYGKAKIGCVALVAILMTLIMLPYIDLYIGLLRISIQMDIKPSVFALQGYLDNSLTPGMPRDEVNGILDATGTKVKSINFRYKDKICDRVGLYIGYWPLNRLEYIICYDEELRLESVILKEPS